MYLFPEKYYVINNVKPGGGCDSLRRKRQSMFKVNHRNTSNR